MNHPVANKEAKGQLRRCLLLLECRYRSGINERYVCSRYIGMSDNSKCEDCEWMQL